MLDFPIDPELRIRADPERVLRRTNEALTFVRRMMLTCTGRVWQYVLRDFEAIRDEWSAIEAVVHLELLLEAEGLLIEENQLQQSPRPREIEPARLSAVLVPYRVDAQHQARDPEHGGKRPGNEPDEGASRLESLPDASVGSCPV